MIKAALLGSLIGILAGLVPGFHTNLIAIVIAGLQLDVWFAAVFLVSVAIARSVIDAVPTIFLGAADEQNVMALLPGHRLLKKGYGIEAVKFCVWGSVLGVIGGVLLIPVFIYLFPILFKLLRPWLFWILVLIILILFYRETKWYWAVLVFTLAGIIGLLSLNSAREPLFPLLSGLFGASGLLLSMFDQTEIPPQTDTDVVTMKKQPMFFSAAIGILAGSIVTLFPGLSPSQAAALTQVKKVKSYRYLILIGALGTVDVLISLVTFYVLSKTRNGAVVVIEQLVGNISLEALISLIAIACLSVGVAAIATLYICKWYARFVERINYSFLCSAVILLLLIMTLILSGWLGLLIFITATAIGLIAPLTSVSRSHAMGCLLLPTLFWLW